MANALLRKTASACVRAAQTARASVLRLAWTHFQDGIRIGGGLSAAPGASVRCSDGGTIELGKRVALGRNTRLVCEGGRIHIGDDVFLGDGCILVSRSSIDIGVGTQIAEYVVIRDQDHRTGAGAVRASGFLTSPIAIGMDCWLGAKSTILRGSRIGDGAVIGAHAVVRDKIPDGALAVGCPARVVRGTRPRPTLVAISAEDARCS